MNRVVKYHISNGVPMRCRAEVRDCPLGFSENEHYPSREAYYEHLEKTDGGASLAGVSKSQGADDVPLPDLEFPAKPEGEVIQAEKIRDQLKTEMPVIDEEPRAFQAAKPLIMNNSNEPRERKNRGEYSEAYVAAKLLTENLDEDYGHFKIRSMIYGNTDFIIDPENERTVMRTADGEVLKLRIDANDLKESNAEIADGKFRKSGTTFESPATAKLIAAMGHPSGILPKAKSENKADIVAWDDEGNRRLISVKSYMGSNPALFNVSKASAIEFSSKIPESMSSEDAERIVSEASEMVPHKAIAHLRKNGIEFSADNATAGEVFKETLSKVSPGAEAAYSEAVLNWASSDGAPAIDVSSEREADYEAVLGAFASRMTPTSYSDDSVRDFAIVNKDGNVALRSFHSEREIGQFFRKRLSFSENESKMGGREFKLDGRTVKMSLNVFGSIAQNPTQARS